MRRTATLALALVLTGGAALAYNTIDYNGAPARWAASRATMYHDPGWSGYPNFINELIAAEGTWTAVSGSNFVFSHGGASPSADLFSTNNGNNDVYFDDLSANVYAITWINPSGPSLYDRDVVFNTDWNWSAGGSGGGVDFRSVAIHELGHVLGLDHETTKPAVMRPYYDASKLEHTLYFDDQEGCRFLYPEPPPPPPPVSDADLVIGGVTLSPDDATSGDEVLVSFSMRNAGTDPTGTFAATVYLTESTSVEPDDRYLGASIQGSLGAGEIRDGRVSVQLPDDLEPRLYHVGVILDPQQATGDRDRTNNSAVATEVVQGGGQALAIGPGTRVTGTLVPFGRDSFTMELAAGTQLDLRSSIEDGSLELTVVQQESNETLLQRRRYRKASGRLRIPADGTYVVYIDSQNATADTYELSVGAKTIRLSGRVAVTHANQIFLPGYTGCTVDAQVRSRSDARPTASWLDVDAETKQNKKGTRVKLRPALVPTTGPLVLVMSQGDGPSGDVDWRIRMKVPKKGRLVRR